MILYMSIISIFVVILFIINIFTGITAYTASTTLLLILGATAIEFAIDGIFASLVHALPNKWFEIDNKFYNVSNGERKFYEKIKIRKWKDKIWELGSLGGFSKKSLKSRSDKNYLKQFIIESNKGVLTHFIGCFAGFLALIILPSKCILSISLPIALVNLVLNLPSLFILRYNTPKLLAGYKRLIRNENLKNSQKVQNTTENLVETTENLAKNDNVN